MELLQKAIKKEDLIKIKAANAVLFSAMKFSEIKSRFLKSEFRHKNHEFEINVYDKI